MNLKEKMGMNHRGHREHRARELQNIEGLMWNPLLGEQSLCLVWFRKPHFFNWFHSVVHFGF